MAFSCGVGAPGGGGGGVRIVVRCLMEWREREAWWIRRVVRAPREGWLELVVNGGGRGGFGGNVPRPSQRYVSGMFGAMVRLCGGNWVRAGCFGVSHGWVS